MVTPFHFASTPHIIFGSGKRSQLIAKIGEYGHRVVLLTGAKSFLGSRFWQELQEDFRNNGLFISHHIIASEPTPLMIDEVAFEYDQSEVDVVVAIGGGSVVDAGKAVAAMIGKNETVKNFLEGVGIKEPDGRTLPFIALPTTSGTGSECTKNSVISEVGERGFKKSLRHDHFVPRVAIIDPELTLSCPANVTAASGMDAFTQLLESYLSTQANPMTDALALSGLRMIREHFEAVMRDGDNLKAREGLAYAAMISGITLANAGLGTVHGFASSVGGRYDIPHGVVCGTLMAPCNDFTVRRLRGSNVNGLISLSKYATVGKMFANETHKSQEYYIDHLLELMNEWTQKFCLPELKEFGVESQYLSVIAKETGNKYNPVKLPEEDLIAILESRM